MPQSKDLLRLPRKRLGNMWCGTTHHYNFHFLITEGSGTEVDRQVIYWVQNSTGAAAAAAAWWRAATAHLEAGVSEANKWVASTQMRGEKHTSSVEIKIEKEKRKEKTLHLLVSSYAFDFWLRCRLLLLEFFAPGTHQKELDMLRFALK